MPIRVCSTQINYRTVHVILACSVVMDIARFEGFAFLPYTENPSLFSSSQMVNVGELLGDGVLDEFIEGNINEILHRLEIDVHDHFNEQFEVDEFRRYEDLQYEQLDETAILGLWIRGRHNQDFDYILRNTEVNELRELLYNIINVGQIIHN